MNSLPVQFRNPDGARAAGALAAGPDFTVAGPLVSCLMVSRGRRFPAEHAIAAFRRQTYPNRELMIVCADPASDLPALLDELGDSRIRYLAAAPATLGELRNRAVAHADGELLCQWDDDDIAAPDRIALQVATLAADGVRACFLDRVTLWCPAERRIALSGVRIWENSMLVWRAAHPVYPAIDRHEDTALARMIVDRHRIALLRAPDAYVYVRHGGNVSGADHFDALFAAGAPIADADATRWHQSAALAAYAKTLGERDRAVTSASLGRVNR